MINPGRLRQPPLHYASILRFHGKAPWAAMQPIEAAFNEWSYRPLRRVRLAGEDGRRVCFATRLGVRSSGRFSIAAVTFLSTGEPSVTSFVVGLMVLCFFLTGVGTA